MCASLLSIDNKTDLNYCFLIYSQRRLAQQKKQRERERKDLDALGRRHLANVRVVQRNVVYVVGIGPRFAKEEVCPSMWPSIHISIPPLPRSLADIYLALKRLLWPVWPHFQDHIGQANSTRLASASRRIVHHISPSRRRRALYFCS